jgi:cyclic pyranopterin phosphate synthase
VEDVALTTNGVLLADAAGDLKKAGLHRLTVSLDTLRADRFHRLTRINAFDRVIAGIEATRRAGFTGLKLDTVVTRGDNDDELVDLVEFARQHDAEVRFIGAWTSGRDEVAARGRILPRRDTRPPHEPLRPDCAGR